jgi:hypothetical protein
MFPVRIIPKLGGNQKQFFKISEFSVQNAKMAKCPEERAALIVFGKRCGHGGRELERIHLYDA